MEKIIKLAIEEHKVGIDFLFSNIEKIKEIALLFIKTLKKGGKIIFIGNGGSASDAQHLSAELVGRFKIDRKPLPAISLSSNISSLTALGNDFGFETIFEKQIQALGNKKDLLIGISTSGNSKNIISAIQAAKKIGMKTVGFLGRDGGALKNLVDVSFVVPIDDTARIQEIHILLGHIICEIIDQQYAKISHSK
ncbi:MAG: D-sedoheptulose 7-phosphate isomerase [Candidatus Omnitrophica bacterium]|nr:D-sedoheptulose 7-phosphate isomerase [Candidatus Omnitrophota bacterium]